MLHQNCSWEFSICAIGTSELFVLSSYWSSEMITLSDLVIVTNTIYDTGRYTQFIVVAILLI